MDVVSPRLSQINSYLDSFENKPLTHEASLLGNLAEIVTELKIELPPKKNKEIAPNAPLPVKIKYQ